MRSFATKKHSNWWANRKIDWNQSYTSTWNHPHRYFISALLKTFSWTSLIEVGCGSGANLINIVKNSADKQVGGIDINPEAIEQALKTFQNGMFRVGSSDDILMSDKSTDVVLSDMHLIYVSPKDIGRYIEEMKRISRNRVVLCEFHSKSFWDRFKLRVTSGYNAYNYKKLLEKHGFYDIMVYKLPEEVWPDSPTNMKFRHVIIAKVL